MTSPDSATLKTMLLLIRERRLEEFIVRAADLEPADLADVFAALDEHERLDLVRQLPVALSSQALIEMSEEEHPEDTLAALDSAQAADIVEELEDDDAADILGELTPEQQARILAEVEDREDVERLLRYDEETAGGRMTGHLVVVRDRHTVGEALATIRDQAEEVDEFNQAFVADGGGRLVGVLTLRTLVVSPPTTRVIDVMEDADVTVRPEVDQEEVARLMARYNVPSIAVVDAEGRLLGRVTFDDVTDVVEAEATEDLLRFGGVSADEELGASWAEAVRSRLPWLSLNLLTAFLAATVVMYFQDTISRTIALAAWMPIIAGMGGNAGTQALAVTVRRLALGQIPVNKSLRVIGKEIAVGATNGFAIGLAVGMVALMTGQGALLGLVVFLAMVGNNIVAGFAGAFIPVLLDRAKIDPAIASSVFVTTLTDIIGFALLLGLAGSLLL